MPGAPLVIRSVVAGDRAQWQPLWDGYNAFYGRADATALPAAVSERTWARFHDASEPVHALVAESAGQLVGLAHYLFHRSTIHIELVCYLQDLFTGPQARGQGVGGALIEAVAERATAGGASRLYWLTHASNATARRLYERVAQHSGFIVYRRQL